MKANPVSFRRCYEVAFDEDGEVSSVSRWLVPEDRKREKNALGYGWAATPGGTAWWSRQDPESGGNYDFETLEDGAFRVLVRAEGLFEAVESARRVLPIVRREIELAEEKTPVRAKRASR